MAYQFQKFQRDPFLVQPLPKSFYHPSPSKEVDERQAIQSPQRRIADPNTQCGAEEGFLKGGPTFKASGLPNIRTLRDFAAESSSGLLRPVDATSSSQFHETWSDNERTPSASVSGNTSSISAVTEDFGVASPNIGDIVKGLEKLNSAGAVDNKMSQDTPTEDAGDSVLRRYIERFRKSTPKSREERMTEKGDKPQFWWLQSSSGSRSDSVVADQGGQLHGVQGSVSEPQGKIKLTKEALLTMDEETFCLQNKADRLLSQSEFSLASSGPLVSTDGLGSSMSVGSSSLSKHQAPFKPTLVRGQESYHRLAPRALGRREEKPRLLHVVSSRSPADDILARWRLRRKIEEASPARGHPDRCPSGNPSRPELDSRLEEFRKKILSQKALVTHEDIHYERQRMTMMMDDVKQDGGILDTERSQTAAEHSEPTTDPVLERLQRITHSGDSSTLSIVHPATFSTREKKVPLPSSLSHGADHNFSINNANLSNAGLVRRQEHSLTTPTLNRNNTASSGPHAPHGMDNDLEPDLFVDDFGPQIICDPKKRNFFLGSSKVVPDSSKVVPDSSKVVPDSSKVVPDSSKVVPDSSKVVPDSSKVVPDSKGGEHEGFSAGKEQDEVAESFQDGHPVEDQCVVNIAATLGSATNSDRKTNNITCHEKGTIAATNSDRKTNNITCHEKGTIAATNSDRKTNNITCHEKGTRIQTDALRGSRRDTKSVAEIDKGNKECVSADRENFVDRNRKHVYSKSNKNLYQFLEAEKPISESTSSRAIVETSDEMVDRDKNKTIVDEEGRENVGSKDGVKLASGSEVAVGKSRPAGREGRRRKARTLAKMDKDGENEDSSGSDVLADITNEGSHLSEMVPGGPYYRRSGRRCGLGKNVGNMDQNIYSGKLHRTFGHVAPEPSHQLQRLSSPRQHPVLSVIGQTITDHLFDGSTVGSSVDSWASMFAQSPGLSHSLHGSAHSIMSPAPSQRGNSPLESTPIGKTSSACDDDEEYKSDGEFHEDTLLQILRQQRDHYLDQLQSIEQKLQDVDT